VRMRRSFRPLRNASAAPAVVPPPFPFPFSVRLQPNPAVPHPYPHPHPHQLTSLADPLAITQQHPDGGDGSGTLLPFQQQQQSVVDEAAKTPLICLRELTASRLFRLSGDSDALARLIHHDMPIRLSRRYLQLSNMAANTSGQLHEILELIRKEYLRTLLLLRTAAPPTGKCTAFDSLLMDIRKRHYACLHKLVHQIRRLRHRRNNSTTAPAHQPWHSQGADNHPLPIEDIFCSSLQMEFVMHHYLRLRTGAPVHSGRSALGLFRFDVTPMQITWNAVDEARRICSAKYRASPQISVKMIDGMSDIDDGVPLHMPIPTPSCRPTVPRCVHYVVLELIKNAMCASINGSSSTDAAASSVDRDVDRQPTVSVRAEQRSDGGVTITVEDRGRGMTNSELTRAWSFLHSTAEGPDETADGVGVDGGRNAPLLAGLGLGLPVSRLYCAFMEGSIDIQSTVGEGTKATVVFPPLA